jgi:hypothetical protein
VRRRHHGQPAVQILINPERQLAEPGLLGFCPLFGAPGEVLFHRVFELLPQLAWRAAVEINDIPDADDAPVEGIGRRIKRDARVVVLILQQIR